VVLPPTPLQNVLLRTCLQADDSASNAVAKRSALPVFINLRCAECGYLCNGLRVCGQNTLLALLLLLVKCKA